MNIFMIIFGGAFILILGLGVSFIYIQVSIKIIEVLSKVLKGFNNAH